MGEREWGEVKWRGGRGLTGARLYRARGGEGSEIMRGMPPGFARRGCVFRLNRAEKRGCDGGDGVGGEQGLQCARPLGDSARDSRD